MLRWMLSVLVSLFFIQVLSINAEEAFDEEAYEASEDVARQNQEAEFMEAVELINAGSFGKGIKELKRLAVSGHAQSQYMLGLFFQSGMGVRQSEKRAVQWLKSSAEQEYPLAMLAYGQAMIYGQGIKVDYDEAALLLEPLTQKDWNFAVPLMDFGMIRSVRSQAAYSMGWLLLTDRLESGSSIERGEKLLQLASDTGSLEASMYLATEYARGEVLERDSELSRRYFEMMQLQVLDSVNREIELFMVELLDDVVKKEMSEAAAEANELFSKVVLQIQADFAKELLDESDEDYDPEFANELLRLAANGGNAEAKSILGRNLWHGIGCEVDREKAESLLRQAAEKQDLYAMYNYTIVRVIEDPSVLSELEFVAYLEETANAGLLHAQLLLDGEAALTVISEKEDIDLIESCLDAKDARAIYADAKRREKGWGQPRESNRSKLNKAYLQSGKLEYHRAEYECGRMFYHGLSKDENIKKAVGWFLKAADKGDAEAAFMLGWIYKSRDDVGQDLERSTHYYQIAAEKGGSGSLNNLANAYYEGTGIEKNVEKAMSLYEQSAEGGNKIAMYNIGRHYYNGESVKLNVVKGLEWLEKAGEGGHQKAVDLLIRHYATESEYHDAVDWAYWTEKSAELGDRGNQKQAAILYRYGIGVPKSNAKALMWIVRYINNGYKWKAKMRPEVLAKEFKEEIVDFLPSDYEAALIYLELLSDESWNGYSPEVALEGASVFKDTKLFEGRFLLAELHLNSDLEGANPKLAKKLYERIYKDCEKADRFPRHKAKAAFKLSRMYADGKYVKQDDQKRAEWMLCAANSGSISARYYYANYLIEGMGVEKNIESGVAELVLLSAQGYGRATLKLGSFLKDGSLGDCQQLVVEREHVVERLVFLAELGDRKAGECLDALGVRYSKPEPIRPVEENPEKEDANPWERRLVG